MIEMKVVEIDGRAGVILPEEVIESLEVKNGDYLYLAEMLDGTYRLTHHSQHETEQMELVEGTMHEEDA